MGSGLSAQAVHAKNLVTSIGGGLAIATLDANTDSLDSDITGGGVVRFAFGYAIGDRWSLGVHYDRIGSDDLRTGLQYVRFTTYMLEATFRPAIGKNAALELHAAGGAGIMALTPETERLPLRMNSGVVTLGLRYIWLFSNTTGGFIGAEHSASGAGQITFNDHTLTDEHGVPLTASWTAQRITAGMIVRF
jgi:hypothetical protein